MKFCKLTGFGVVMAAGAALAAPTVTVDTAKQVGPIKVVHAVNNGPSGEKSDQQNNNFDDYAALRIPYARTHDAARTHAYGGHHTIDISYVFPDFSKDEKDPANYDFTCTDYYLETMIKAGTEPYYRLGQSIEHWIKKYDTTVPPDYEKFARVCEMIIRHYTEGWGNGYKWKMTYWEFGNEPDLGNSNGKKESNPDSKMWRGSMKQFCDLFVVVISHLKKNFPNLQIGGPSLASSEAWVDATIEALKAKNVPLDFFSWHAYTTEARWMFGMGDRIRQVLDKNGYTSTKSHMNEWNYVDGCFSKKLWKYSLEVDAGRFQHKGAAFIADTMNRCQHARCVDMAMYYDARVEYRMNGIFDHLTLDPLKGYYAFQAWSELFALGTEIQSTVGDHQDQFVSTAAASKDGKKRAMLVSRYHDNNNIVDEQWVTVKLADGASLAAARVHVTDIIRSYTEIRPVVNADGSIKFRMNANSFALVEW